jgi:glycosyltransferase AglD
LKARIPLVCVGMAVLLALALALAPVDLREATSYVTGHPLEVALALLAYTGAFVLRAVAWRPLIGVRIPTPKLFALLMGALFLNHAAPAKAGDLGRMYALSRSGVPAAQAVTSVVLSRLVDLAGLLAVLVAAFALAGSGGWWGGVFFPILAFAGMAVALFVLACLSLPDSFVTRFGGAGQYAVRMQEALRETTWPKLIRSFAFAAPAWVLEAGILLVVGWGLDLGLSYAEIVAATCFAVLVAAVPLAPGSVGTYEAGMVAALLVFGVPTESAFVVAVATHAIKFLYAFAAAPFAFLEGLEVVRKESKPDEAGVKV